MAKKEQVTTEAKENIANLNDLVKEFKSGKMVPRKLVLLKIRLAELWKAKTISEKEELLLESILSRDRMRGTIADTYYEDVLNRIEASKCADKCRCKTDDAPPVFFLKKDQICSFERHDQPNIEKAQAGSLYQYCVYFEKEIPPEHQMTRELLLKEERGHHAAEDEYPKVKYIMKRLVLDDAFFDRLFDVEEDLLSGESKKEDEYIF